jgi:hypothetical protein
MIDHTTVLLALRAKLLTLSVVTTGSTQISATATGYARASGSFVTDGFRVGMEVYGSGFTTGTNNRAKTLTGVTALTLTCADCAVESAGTRTVAVTLPTQRAWTNVAFAPTAAEPYVEEAYLPGPMVRTGLGPTAYLEVLPQYVVRVYVPAGTGVDAALQYADALLSHFAPNTSLTVSGSTLVVRGDVAPFAGQVISTVPGFAVVPVTVPLRLRTTNTI